MPTNPAISCGYLFQDSEKKTVYPQMDPMWDCFVFSMSTFKIFLESHTLSLSLSLSTGDESFDSVNKPIIEWEGKGGRRKFKRWGGEGVRWEWWWWVAWVAVRMNHHSFQLMGIGPICTNMNADEVWPIRP